MKKFLIIGLVLGISILLGTAYTRVHSSLTTLEPTIPVIEEPVIISDEISDVTITDTSTPPAIPLGSPEDIIDSDGDGLSDSIEQKLGTNPFNIDTDGDGYSDSEEIDHGYSPLNSKPDRSLVSRMVKVDLDHQQLYYFMNGVEVRSFPVSTGLPGTVTPRGTFKIFNKIPLARYIGRDYDLPNVPWNLEFKPGYYIHGTYWHNKFGIEPMSHGCVNVSIDNAKKIYDFLQIGDQITIYGKTPPGQVVN